MTISDNKYGGEIITKKGKIYKFDDIQCLQSFKKNSAFKKEEISNTYYVNFEAPHEFIEDSRAYLFKSSAFHTPMEGNVAAFKNKQSLNNAADKFAGVEISETELVK